MMAFKMDKGRTELQRSWQAKKENSAVLKGDWEKSRLLNRVEAALSNTAQTDSWRNFHKKDRRSVCIPLKICRNRYSRLKVVGANP